MLNRALTKVKTVAIGGHIRPDGDCVGSCMGLYLYIKKNYPEIDVDLYLEDIPECFKTFFPSTSQILHELKDKEYDLFIVLDCAAGDRLGFSNILFGKAKSTLCIDHHVSNRAFADENYIIPEASSTAELVYRLLDKENITSEIAEFLYLGIVHDTGVFQYSSTSPETMEAAADLMRKGVRANEIIDKTFYEKTYVQNKILGKAIEECYLLAEDKVIVSCITKEMMDDYGAIPKDLEGIVSQLRVTKGVEVAVFLYEIGKDEFKVSLRATNDVDVSKIAEIFGGGGHKKAAGVSIKGTSKDIVEQLVKYIQAQL